MSNTEPGWYPDPSGNDSFLRYWDGSAWTDQTLPTRTQSASTESAVYTGTATSAAETTATTYEQAYTQQQAQPQQAQQATPQPQTSQPQQAYTQQAQPQYAQQPQTTTTNVYIQANSINTQGALYPMTDNDRTLRLVGFILNAVVLAGTFWLIFPLAWMIPMLVRAWGIYKGTKPNTTAFGVCNLLFFSFISGILFLCSKKDL